MSIYCAICNRESHSLLSLAAHFRQSHNISSRDYYDTYLKKEGEGICPICSKPTKWRTLAGYDKVCSSRVCGAKHHRANLAADPIKNEAFKEKVRGNMRRIHSEEDDTRTLKMAKTKREFNAALTAEERQHRYSRYFKCTPEKVAEINAKAAQQLLGQIRMGRNRYHQGLFKPINPQKYAGDVNNIHYRSGLELKLMSYLDRHPDVIAWASEEVIVPYVSPVDNRIHRYFPDFVVKMRGPNGQIVKKLIEIKPRHETAPPKPPKSNKGYAAYRNAVKTWAVNSAKWKAAEAFCEEHKMQFQILTEVDLGVTYAK